MRFEEEDAEKQRRRERNRALRAQGKDPVAMRDAAKQRARRRLEERAGDLADAIRNGTLNDLMNALIRHKVIQ